MHNTGASILRISLEQQVQKGEPKKMRVGLRTDSYRYIVLEVDQSYSLAVCTFRCSIEERWDELFQDRHPIKHTIVLDKKDFHVGEYDCSDSPPMDHYTRQLIRLTNSTSGKATERVLYCIYHKLILDPEIVDCIENRSTPRFLQKWVPEYLKFHIDMIMHDRTQKVKEIQEC